MNIEFLPLPKELHWNIIKFLKHPLAEIFENHPAYNLYLSSEEDIYTNINNETTSQSEVIEPKLCLGETHEEILNISYYLILN